MRYISFSFFVGLHRSKCLPEKIWTVVDDKITDGLSGDKEKVSREESTFGSEWKSPKGKGGAWAHQRAAARP